MKLPRFYCPIPLSSHQQIELPSTTAHHISHVLRLATGNKITVFNGNGGCYEATIIRIDRKNTWIETGQHHVQERESPLSIHLIQALQTGDKMDYTIQKSIELGVNQISPISSKRCTTRLNPERANKRVNHWQAIAIATCEQCGRNRIPSINPIHSLDQFLGQELEYLSNQTSLRLLLDPAAEKPLSALVPTEHLELLVGSEGGFDLAEIDHARQCHFIPIRLGPRILRTETAALAAVAALQALWGDFSQ